MKNEHRCPHVPPASQYVKAKSLETTKVSRLLKPGKFAREIIRISIPVDY